MNRLIIKFLAVAGSAMFLLAGCSPSPSTPPLAPEKPLSQAEQSLLKQIEDTPQRDRQAFAGKHRTEITQFAMQNRAFGERLNAVMQVNQAAN